MATDTRQIPSSTATCVPKRKDLLRVQGLHNGGHQRRNVEKLVVRRPVVRRQSALRGSLSFGFETPIRQVTHEAVNGGGCVPD
jgi:hypothetical protein